MKKKTSKTLKTKKSPSRKIEKIGMITSSSLEKNTGKSWDHWIETLEKAGAAYLSHKEIVAYLRKKYKFSIYWQQSITSGYEIHIGRKIEGRNAKGYYDMSVTKTLPVEHKALWRFLMSEEGMAVWLKPLSPFEFEPKRQFEVEGGVFGEVRTMNPPYSARLKWQDTDWEKHSFVQLHTMPRPKNKSIIIIHHGQLKSAMLKEQMRSYWKDIMKDLELHLDVVKRG